MKLITSNDSAYISHTGKEIIENYPEVYTPAVLWQLKETIASYVKDETLIEDVLYRSVYDYWMYGISTEEEFYLNLLDKTAEEKSTYISHMGRINLMHYLNKREDEYLLKNKYETYKRIGSYYHRELLYIHSEDDFPKFADFCTRHKSFVVKPTGLAVSIGIRRVDVSPRENIHELFIGLLEEIKGINSRYKWASEGGLIVEELIIQGEEMACLHRDSVNSVRLTTINIDGKIHIWYPVIRIGVHGNFLCSGAVGSILSGINKESGETETIGYNERGETFTEHPDTQIPLKGIQIPKWRELCELAVQLAAQFPTLRYIGWDFVWNDKKQWCVMEANENGEFLSQIAYQHGQKDEFAELINYKHITKKQGGGAATLVA